MQRAPISLVVITLNEGPNIERCLRSAPWVDDIVVLDSGSTDDTVARARKLGARVFIESFRGYREQKIRATALARHDWVLSLDGDEALSPELAGELQEKFVSKLLQNDGTADLADGFEMPRLSFHLG
ncbi:MAG: glycosyltransferase family 2 protein, partial [Bdellovibrionia bacterium]